MHQPLTYTVDGDAIRTERMQAGMTRKQLAAAAGLSRRYLCHLENGTRDRMSPPLYIALRAALDTTDERLSPRPTEAVPQEGT
ncbi:helix-turn-helix domain-containing protein [Streptomyces sp. Je 1-369]|uniref:helix-turn-helix domain-containing protein n=1 Tax=Streptomyces sp. Je 1-369 TaxID=2966192 RepID=UPI002286560C|nr:helix-turn-helix transcriptional regulator [Streptomyces sp. Je 1-369]WAL93922.1 helix-turn-helix domain-containing protein [Streptomyces sp. Je 1-369]